jgi:mannose-6-phosphate isomerase-like protein (cupin superfamily)
VGHEPCLLAEVPEDRARLSEQPSAVEHECRHPERRVQVAKQFTPVRAVDDVDVLRWSHAESRRDKVIEGELVIELEGRDTVRLRPNQGYTVPKGVMHKTSAPTRTVIVMIESAGVVPAGD